MEVRRDDGCIELILRLAPTPYKYWKKWQYAENIRFELLFSKTGNRAILLE